VQMIRALQRRKRTSFDEDVPAFDSVGPLSGRLAEPLLPPMLMNYPPPVCASAKTTADSVQTPNPQNRLALKKSQQNQVCVNQVS